MNRLLPGKIELLMMVVAAMICGAVVSTQTDADLTMAALAIPLFFGAAMLGLWRSGKLAQLSRPVDEELRPADAD